MGAAPHGSQSIFRVRSLWRALHYAIAHNPTRYSAATGDDNRIVAADELGSGNLHELASAGARFHFPPDKSAVVPRSSQLVRRGMRRPTDHRHALGTSA